MIKRFRHIVIDILTRKLLKAITIEEVLILSGKEWLIGRHKLSAEELISLREEAMSFERSLLWKLIVRELKYQATLERYDHAKTPDDMVFGKAMAYNISLIEKYVKNLKKAV